MAKKKATRSPAAPDRSNAEGTVERGDPVEFEQAVEEIEQIVLGLEGGEWSLAESLRQYERAVGRLQTCHSLLQDAERHIALLSGFDADGNPMTETLEGDPASSLEQKQQSRSRNRGVSPSRSDARERTEDPPELF